LILLNAVLGWIANFYQIWIGATAPQDLTPEPPCECSKNICPGLLAGGVKNFFKNGEISKHYNWISCKAAMPHRFSTTRCWGLFYYF